MLDIISLLFPTGKPTLEKCKKLRKKIEREKEVAELDLGNIIDSNGKFSLFHAPYDSIFFSFF